MGKRGGVQKAQLMDHRNAGSLIALGLTSLVLWTQIGCSRGLENRSGAQLTGASSGSSGLDETSSSRRLSRTLEPGTNFTRGPSVALLIRLQKIFGTTQVPSSFLRGSETLGQALGSADRFTNSYQEVRSASTLSQAHLRNQLASSLCASLPSTHTLFSTSAVTLPGESVPTSEATRIAWAAARNAWLYPYSDTSSEVSALAELYSASKTAAGTAAALQDVCFTVFLAPQFWLGNLGEWDVVRKITLELGGQVPSFTDHFYPIMQGTKTLSELVREMQSSTRTWSSTSTTPHRDAASAGGCYERGETATSCTYSPYLDIVTQWHQDWLGFKDFTRYWYINDPRAYTWDYGSTYGASTLGSQPFTLVKYQSTTEYSTAPGARTSGLNGKIVLHPDNRELATAKFFADPEWCDGNVIDQPFNPETTRIEFEQFRGGSWSKVSSWSKDVFGNWSETSGTDASGNAVTLKDLGVPAFSSASSSAITSGSNTIGYTYSFGSPTSATLNLNPIQGTFFNTGPKTFRVIRYVRDASGTEVAQTGFSKIKLWWSGDEVYVCNNLSRILASCAWRPDGSTVSTHVTYNWTPTQKLDSATPFRVPLYNANASTNPGTLAPIFVGNPKVLDGFRCGESQPNKTTESARFPNGTSSSHNPIATYARITSGPFLLKSGSQDLLYGSAQDEETRPILYENSLAILRDMEREPIRLISDILTQGLDYRLLLTSDYTFGRGQYELFMRTQGGLILPHYPNYSPSSSDYSESHPIYPRLFPSTPRSALVPSTFPTSGTLWSGIGELIFRDDYSYLNSFHYVPSTLTDGGKPTAGILTMPAFLAQSGGKIRTVAHTIFTKLTCQEIIYPAVATTNSTHLAYVPDAEITSGAHVDPNQGCVSCHINLDPLAAALSSGFLKKGNTSSTGVTLESSSGSISLLGSGGEMRYHHLFETYGMRGSSAEGSASRGALFGQEVTGVEEVAEVLANSDLFAQCAVKKAFEGLFGRPADTYLDQLLVQRVADKFQGELNYNYNRMVEELALSPEFAERK